MTAPVVITMHPAEPSDEPTDATKTVDSNPYFGHDSSVCLRWGEGMVSAARRPVNCKSSVLQRWLSGSWARSLVTRETISVARLRICVGS